MANCIVVASYNPGKVEEIRQVLADFPLQVLSLDDLPDPPQLNEPYPSFAQNAAEKAVTTARATGYVALADDSGLVVPALDGAPGTRSSRVAATDGERIKWLLDAMDEIPADERNAYFVCIMVLADTTGQILGTWQGRVDGTITAQPRGEGGFGYDPVFLYPPDGQTFAEMTTERKNQVSHRGQALRAFVGDLPDVLSTINANTSSAPAAGE